MTETGHNYTNLQLRQFVARIEHLESEKAELSADIKEVYAEVKAAGYDTKVLRRIVRDRKRDPDDLREEEELREVYRRALGDFATSPLGQAAIDRAAE